jgi:hypothetical protein
MAQSSTTISGMKAIESLNGGSDIRFDYSGGVSTIQSTTTILTGSGELAVRDLFTISGSNNNNSTFTVKSINSTKSFTVEEIVTNESAGATITLTYAGFVTDKYKGDGYYSQVDGVHTVAYHVSSTLIGTIKMQGSLATTPTEDDWFDINGTSATYTGSSNTSVSSYNFTGNFVWVRAKVTGMTAGSVIKILYNH